MMNYADILRTEAKNNEKVEIVDTSEMSLGEMVAVVKRAINVSGLI